MRIKMNCDYQLLTKNKEYDVDKPYADLLIESGVAVSTEIKKKKKKKFIPENKMIKEDTINLKSEK